MYRMAWTDERMDDFAAHTDQRFDAVDKRFDAVDKRFDAVDERFGAVDKRFDKLEHRVETGFNRVNDRIDDLHRLILQLGAGALVTFVIGFAGIIVTRL